MEPPKKKGSTPYFTRILGALNMHVLHYSSTADVFWNLISSTIFEVNMYGAFALVQTPVRCLGFVTLPFNIRIYDDNTVIVFNFCFKFSLKSFNKRM